jgi:phosphopantothenoylcysteine decarboxylase/phosphopantothenate--cysteine ligase
MRDAVFAVADETDAVVMSAAVADFRPAVVASEKIKKTDAPSAIVLERNPDILAELGARDSGAVLVGFAAETTDVERHAREKLLAKRCDLVVGNDVSDPAIGFGTDHNRVVLVSKEGTAALPVQSKRALARVIVDRVTQLVRERAGA